MCAHAGAQAGQKGLLQGVANREKETQKQETVLPHKENKNTAGQEALLRNMYKRNVSEFHQSLSGTGRKIKTHRMRY